MNTDPTKEKVAVLGLGYVGLPLALEFSAHVPVVGYDVSEKLVSKLSSEYPGKAITFTSDPGDMSECTVFIICVPTPLRRDGKPDLSYVKNATFTVSSMLKKGDMVILESTTYPGTTREMLKPMLEEGGLTEGEDFHLVFSPERIDPGNPSFEVRNITKLVGGMTGEARDRAVSLYGLIVDRVVPVESPEVAEAAKIMENIFRNVNIALVNEMALVFERMGIDTWKVIEAAATKPFGYMPFYPGPGVGGHCIPLDPHYLSYQARKHGISPRFIELSADINRFMPVHTVNLARAGLERAGKTLRGARVLVCGLSYKAGIADTRESPAYPLVEELLHDGCAVSVHDPYVKEFESGGERFRVEPDLAGALQECDCVIFLVGHDEYLGIDWSAVSGKVVVDARNLFPEGVGGNTYVGLGKAAIR